MCLTVPVIKSTKGLLMTKRVRTSADIFTLQKMLSKLLHIRSIEILHSLTRLKLLRPFLEIYADDVKCSHGATIGQLDENAMFYLRTRGICLRNARMLLMFAFANEIANLVLIEKLRERLNDMIKRRLSGELTICDQCMMNCADKENLIYDIDTTRLRS